MTIKESIEVLRQLKKDPEIYWKPKHNEPVQALSQVIGASKAQEEAKHKKTIADLKARNNFCIETIKIGMRRTGKLQEKIEELQQEILELKGLDEDEPTAWEQDV